MEILLEADGHSASQADGEAKLTLRDLHAQGKPGKGLFAPTVAKLAATGELAASEELDARFGEEEAVRRFGHLTPKAALLIVAKEQVVQVTSRHPGPPARAASRPRERRSGRSSRASSAGPGDPSDRPPRPQIAVAAELRHRLWLALPSANGTRRDIRADIERLTEILNGRNRWHVVAVIADKNGREVQLRDRELGGLYADKRGRYAAPHAQIPDPEPEKQKRDTCSRCARPFADPDTRGKVSGRGWCRSCEAHRRAHAPSRRAA